MEDIMHRYLLCLFILLPCISHGNPEQLVRDTLGQLSTHLTKADNQSIEAIEKVVEGYLKPNLDMERISKVVLGNHWKRASFKQKNTFIECFSRQLTHNQAESFQKWHSGEWQIISTSYNSSGTKAAVSLELNQLVVDMKVVLRLYKSGQNWFIYDAALNGISLLKQFRDDYALKIERQGLGRTLARLCQQHPLVIKTLHMAANEWPPYISRSLPGHGLAVELVSKVLKLAGYEVAMTFTPWQKVGNGMQDGQFDISIANWKNASRQRSLLFSEPYFHNQLVVISTDTAVNDITTFKQRLTLGKQSVGLMEDYAYGDLIPKNTRAIYHKHYSTLLRKLAKKEIDMALSDLNVAQYYLNSHANLQPKLSLSNQAIESRSLHITMLKNHPVGEQVINDFDQALKAFLNTSAYKSLHAKYKLKAKKP
jgi:polar amino acid transport system substrate-binding protein